MGTGLNTSHDALIAWKVSLSTQMVPRMPESTLAARLSGPVLFIGVPERTYAGWPFIVSSRTSSKLKAFGKSSTRASFSSRCFSYFSTRSRRASGLSALRLRTSFFSFSSSAFAHSGERRSGRRSRAASSTEPWQAEPPGTSLLVTLSCFWTSSRSTKA